MSYLPMSQYVEQDLGGFWDSLKKIGKSTGGAVLDRYKAGIKAEGKAEVAQQLLAQQLAQQTALLAKRAEGKAEAAQELPAKKPDAPKGRGFPPWGKWALLGGGVLVVGAVAFFALRGGRK